MGSGAGLIWDCAVSLDRLGSVRVYPKLFQKGLDDFPAIYLGDVN